MTSTHPKVLILGPCRKTRGGITSVLKLYEKCDFWKEYHCRWIGTYIDRNIAWKISYAITALFIFILIAWRYDIVHITVAAKSSAMRKMFFFFLARLMRKKTIIHVHVGTQLSVLLQSRCYRYFFTYADQVIVLSNTIADYIKPYSIRTKVIYNPSILRVTSKKDWNKNVLYAGHLTPAKGYRDLLKAFASIAMRHPDWKLIFAGSGEIHQARQLVEQYGISNQVELRGWVGGNEKEDLFHNSSILCLPSYAEGLPMVILEAWGYGIPVVCTPVGGLAEFCHDTQNALLFSPGDTVRLASQLERLITSKELCVKLSQDELVFCKNYFDLNLIGSQWADIYREIGKQHK